MKNALKILIVVAMMAVPEPSFISIDVDTLIIKFNVNMNSCTSK